MQSSSPGRAPGGGNHQTQQLQRFICSSIAGLLAVCNSFNKRRLPVDCCCVSLVGHLHSRRVDAVVGALGALFSSSVIAFLALRRIVRISRTMATHEEPAPLLPLLPLSSRGQLKCRFEYLTDTRYAGAIEKGQTWPTPQACHIVQKCHANCMLCPLSVLSCFPRNIST